jgi:UDP-2,3-diacylglucosamine hydrolase
MSAALVPPMGASPAPPVGLIAAGGRFPLYFAEKAHAAGLPLVIVGLRDLADPSLERFAWRFHWSRPAQLGRMIRLFSGDGARRLVMAGKVYKAAMMYRPWRVLAAVPDWRGLRAWYFSRRTDNRDHSILLSVIDEFARDGLTFASALDLCPELLVKPGVLTRRRPSAAEYADIAFGWDLAKKISQLDVGQSIAVKDKNVLAVEAIEGTDRAILRAGEYARGGFTLVKVAKQGHDMRFDVPTVGETTIETMAQAGGRVLALEADKTILLDEGRTVALADRLGISIVALSN